VEPVTEPINFNKIKAIRIDEPETEPKMSRLWRVLENADSRRQGSKFGQVFTAVSQKKPFSTNNGKACSNGRRRWTAAKRGVVPAAPPDKESYCNLTRKYWCVPIGTKL
jgi:hypothetical protein